MSIDPVVAGSVRTGKSWTPALSKLGTTNLSVRVWLCFLPLLENLLLEHLNSKRVKCDSLQFCRQCCYLPVELLAKVPVDKMQFLWKEKSTLVECLLLIKLCRTESFSVLFLIAL